jgi:microcystin-dependent protein
MRGRWLTPAALPSSVIQCVIEFPDGEEIRALVRGALYLLSVEENYEEFGAVTPQEIADAMRQTLFLFNLDDCMLIPVGTILMTAAQIEPEGWKICNGSALFRADFPDLFALIGTTYGPGDGSITFNIPDLRGRVPAGHAPGDADFDVLGETGGAKTHTLIVGEMPSHKHNTKTAFQVVVGGAPGDSVPAGSGGVVQDANQMSTAGGGAAHNNLAPYLVLNYIIKF